MSDTNEAAQAAETQTNAAVEQTETPPEKVETSEAASAEKPEPASKNIRHLAQKDKALREREQAIKDAQKRLDEFESFKAGAKKDPLTYLKAAGLDYESLTRHVLEMPDPEDDPGKRALAQVEAFKEQQAKAAKDAQTAHEAQVIKDVHGVIEKEVLGNEKYDLLSAFDEVGQIDARGEIVAYIRKSHELGKQVSIAQAADAIEDWLEKNALERLTKSKKLQIKIIPPKPAPDAEKASSGDSRPKQAAPGAQDRALRTLTNSQSANVTDADSPRPRSMQEQRELGRKIWRGEVPAR